LNTLAMPAHCVSIAHILNGGCDNFTYNESKEAAVRFIAPDAKVLLVDDINTNLVVAKGLLLPYKMEIDLRNSGIEAIKAVRSKDYDIVFMDHKMPGMDGIEALEHIRALGDEGDVKYKQLPVIALTANAVAGMREMFLECGFNDYLSKPIDTGKLNTILEQWVPAEKQKNLVVKDSASPFTAGRELPFVIDGLDVAKGISISGGSVEYYIETLAIFHEDGLDRIKALNDCLSGGDLPLYATYVHALKSSSAGVGAGELSGRAAALEEFAGHGELNMVKARNAEFIAALEQLLGNIGKALKVYKNKKKTPSSSGTDTLSSDLSQLKTALKNMDAGSINRMTDRLKKMSYVENASAIKMLTGKILMAEYDEAAALIDDLLKDGE